ncbi:MAG: hypothetical protein HYV25_00175 [Candidatus Harrisonbacteria bacterium]|nr:hypothetical protein [Candidatus Harrisonbacteria bacterium]
MSRRKDRGDVRDATLSLLLVVGAIVVFIVIIGISIGRVTKEATHTTSTPAATVPPATQSATQPEEPKPEQQPKTKPVDEPKGEALKQPPDGAPSNPLFLAWSELENGMSSGDAEAVVKKYGDYANLGEPFISHAKAGDAYVWKWESRNKEWRMRLQYNIMRSGTTLGVFYAQEHVDYTKTMAK